MIPIHKEMTDRQILDFIKFTNGEHADLMHIEVAEGNTYLVEYLLEAALAYVETLAATS